MAYAMLEAAGAGTVGPWLNVRAIRQTNTKLRFHATGNYNTPVIIEASHFVGSDADAYTVGTINPGGGVVDLDVPLERVRVSTQGNQAVGTTATVMLSTGS